MQFQKPDKKTLERMTVLSVSVLIRSLKRQRKAVMQPYTDQIRYYEQLLERKKAERNANAKTSS